VRIKDANDVNVATFAYDALGRRIRKIDSVGNAKWTVRDGLLVGTQGDNYAPGEPAPHQLFASERPALADVFKPPFGCNWCGATAYFADAGNEWGGCFS